MNIIKRNYEIKRNPMSSPKQINQAFKKIIEIYKNVKI